MEGSATLKLFSLAVAYVAELEGWALTSASVQINITESPTAAQVGPAILEKLRASEGQLPWDGTTPSFTREPGKRTYILMAMWPADDKPAQTMPAKPNSPAKGGTK